MIITSTRPERRLFQLMLLALTLCAGMYCRSALGPLQEAMRLSLHFSDNQMALLQGTAMALPMVLCSVPVGMLADRFSRVRLLRLVVVLMPVGCFLSACASQFTTLFLARCLAGVCAAAAPILGYSIIGDMYAPHERGRASMVMASGEILGAPVAFTVGGWLLFQIGSSGTTIGWRATLSLMGGLVLPLMLLMLCLREPPRQERLGSRTPTWMELWPQLWRYRVVALPILFARGMVWLADGSVFVWAAPSFSRRFHVPADRIGTIMGVALLVSGLVGPALGGPLADYCQRHGGPRRTVRVMAGIALFSLPLALFTHLPTINTAAAGMMIFLTLGFMIATAGVTLSIVVIPGELRGAYFGMAYVVGSLFFVGLAPLAVSTLSGALGGESMIGQALSLVCASASFLGMVVFAICSRFFPTTALTPTVSSVAREAM